MVWVRRVARAMVVGMPAISQGMRGAVVCQVVGMVYWVVRLMRIRASSVVAADIARYAIVFFVSSVSFSFIFCLPLV